MILQYFCVLPCLFAIVYFEFPGGADYTIAMVIRNVQVEIIVQKLKVLHKVLSRLWINDL